MDVGDPSNLERIRWLYRDHPQRLREDVVALSISDAETRQCISDVFRRTGYVLDPHSAVGVRARAELGRGSGERYVVLSTAHPAKFPDVVEEAIGRPVELPEGIAAVLDAEEHMVEIAAEMPALSAALDAG